MRIVIPHSPECFGRTELFVPEHHDDQLGIDIAITMCGRCRFRVECAEQGRRHPDQHSIRAGIPQWDPFAPFLLLDLIERETP